MQTYLPYADFYRSAQCLDSKRLNNQRNECFVLLNALLFKAKAWSNHPVTRMWMGYHRALLRYMLAIDSECHERGIKSSKETEIKIHQYIMAAENKQLYKITIAGRPDLLMRDSLPVPEWLGDSLIHENHQAKLLSKDPAHYGQFGWTVEPDPRSWYPVAWGKKQQLGFGGAV